jgi:GNAT superfamily N-acetyltransferase
MRTAPMIRLATPADAPVLARMRYEFRRTSPAAREPEAAFVERCTRWMAGRLRDGADGEGSGHRWRCWVAEDADGIVGHIWLGLIEKIPNPAPEPEEHAYITNFYVRERARGTGVGSVMLSAVLRWCEDRHVHAVILWPTARSRSLYERHGFTPRGHVMERLVADDLFTPGEDST